ncbi:hypothetical protein ACH5RR_037287 [Cinchona calisaya]|uniref:Protein kinase domain-containing protein n=1 Tax=Cinchona calisaya TaxID=153742 RepID=A0ABD2Y706_9GENT
MQLLYLRLTHCIDTVNNLDWQSTVKILLQLADAFQYLLDMNIVLLDIKPDNILIDEENNLKICDFDSARKIGQETKIFNERYTAPEAARNGTVSSIRKVESPSVIFSMGVIMLQLIMKDNQVGNVPRHPRDAQAQREAHQGNARSKKKNTYDTRDIHISIKAASLMQKNDHLVHDTLQVNEERPGGYTLEKAKRISKLAIKCCSQNPRGRPKLENVKKELLTL